MYQQNEQRQMQHFISGVFARVLLTRVGYNDN